MIKLWGLEYLVKILSFFLDECCLLTTDAPDMNNKLCQAMEALQDRPVLFKWEMLSIWMSNVIFYVLYGASWYCSYLLHCIVYVVLVIKYDINCDRL